MALSSIIIKKNLSKNKQPWRAETSPHYKDNFAKMHFLSRLPIYIFKCLFIVISIVYATGSQNTVPSSLSLPPLDRYRLLGSKIPS